MPSQAKVSVDSAAHGTNAVRLIVSGALVFDTVQTLRDSSFPLLSQSSDLIFDLAHVTRTDSAGLALLIFWMRETAYRNTSIKFENIPTQLADIAHLCGLSWLPGLSNTEASNTPL